MAVEAENNLIAKFDIFSSNIDYEDLMAYMVASRATKALGSRVLEAFISPMESEITTSANVRVITYDLSPLTTIGYIEMPTQVRPKPKGQPKPCPPLLPFEIPTQVRPRPKGKPKPLPPPLPLGVFPLPENFLDPRTSIQSRV